MSRSHSPVTQVVAIGIGAALFFVLGRFVAIPFVPNTSINIQYAVLAVFAILYGPLVGALAGLIGHVLIDATGYGIWISWEIASGVFGLLVGLALLRHAIEDVAPLGDVVIYGEPAAKVWAQGALAFVSNSVTACVLGTIILAVYARTRTRTGSLSREQ